MIDTWKKLFSPKDNKPDPLALANAKIVGLQDRNAKLAGDLAEALRKNRELDGLASVLRDQRNTAGSALAASQDRLEAVVTELISMKTTRERCNANLRNHKPVSAEQPATH